MKFKGFEASVDLRETPNPKQIAEKPLKVKDKLTKRVDINILKSKLQETETKELKKNILILSSLISIIGILGIYLSF